MTVFVLTNRLSPRSTLFPYTTLFRSHLAETLALQAAQRTAQLALVALDDVARQAGAVRTGGVALGAEDRKSTRLNSSHQIISYAVFCLNKKNLYATSYSLHHTYLH